MSIYNMISAIIGGGGVEYEEGTFQGDDSNNKWVYFSNTHTTAPDLVLCYYTYNGGASSALANIEYINPQGFLEGYTGSVLPYRLSLRNDGVVSTQTAANELTSTYFKLETVPTLNHYNTYVWYAFWFNGSGSGGGGGGTAKNVQTNQTTSRTSSTSLTSVNSLTCSTAGTYDVYWTCDRSSTSGTWSSRLYLGGTAYGSEQTTWSNHVQTVHLSNVTISANQTVAVYVKARGTNYYGYAPQLTIVQS